MPEERAAGARWIGGWWATKLIWTWRIRKSLLRLLGIEPPQSNLKSATLLTWVLWPTQNTVFTFT
jgi:hypothetical protein